MSNLSSVFRGLHAQARVVEVSPLSMCQRANTALFFENRAMAKILIGFSLPIQRLGLLGFLGSDRHDFDAMQGYRFFGGFPNSFCSTQECNAPRPAELVS
jgi:hypothetical protein